MRREVRLGGFGGQGIMLAGQILGRAAILAGKYATMTQSYGPEMRGARVAADVVIADEPIDYPKVISPEISVFLFQGAYDYYRREVGELLIYDQDLVKIGEPPDGGAARAFPIQANRLAEELGNRVVVNIVMLGTFAAISGLLPVEALEEAVLRSVPKKALELNKEAFRRGLEHGKKLVLEGQR
ncbi:MAG: 2-oxoacid:acceptor oxidoreductase family protein [Candidatus Bipolaricaulia bacterium]